MRSLQTLPELIHLASTDKRAVQAMLGSKFSKKEVDEVWSEVHNMVACLLGYEIAFRKMYPLWC